MKATTRISESMNKENNSSDDILKEIRIQMIVRVNNIQIVVFDMVSDKVSVKWTFDTISSCLLLYLQKTAVFNLKKRL